MSQDATLFDLFGGIRATAVHLNEAPSTVQDWKAAGRIPASKQPDVLLKARELSLPVTALDVIFPCGIPDRYASLISPETGKGYDVSGQGVLV